MLKKFVTFSKDFKINLKSRFYLDTLCTCTYIIHKCRHTHTIKYLDTYTYFNTHTLVYVVARIPHTKLTSLLLLKLLFNSCFTPYYYTTLYSPF